jgi:septal ring factor EnvC (AmiA/AmiB activator)
MIRIHPILAAVLCATLAWGCARQAAAPSADKNKSIEARVAKLESELRSATDAREAAEAKLAATEGKLKSEQLKASSLETDRDQLRAALLARMAEKDALQSQFDGFRKSLKDLVGQVDAAAAGKPIPAAGSSTAANLLPNPAGF